jgi:hypothetical protein
VSQDFHARAPLLAALLLASCASSTFTETWRDPGYASRPVERVLVIGITLRDEALQSSFENALALELRLRGYQVATASSIFAPWQLDAETVLGYAKEKNGDLIIQLGLVNRTSSTLVPSTYQAVPLPSGVPSPYSSGLGGPTGGPTYGFTLIQQPGQVNQDLEVMAEIQVYSLRTGGVVWRAQSKTINVRGDQEAAEVLARALVSDLGKAGILVHRP